MITIDSMAGNRFWSIPVWVRMPASDVGIGSARKQKAHERRLLLEVLRELRKQRDLTQGQMARSMGLNNDLSANRKSVSDALISAIWQVLVTFWGSLSQNCREIRGLAYSVQIAIPAGFHSHARRYSCCAGPTCMGAEHAGLFCTCRQLSPTGRYCRVTAEEYEVAFAPLNYNRRCLS